MKKYGFYILLFTLAVLMPLSAHSKAYGAVGDFLYTIGAEYSFNNPVDVAVGGSGNVYIADASNNRILVFDSSGTLIMKWGSYGTGDGQFYYPHGIAVDESGNVFVADQHNHRIQVFNSSGIYIRKWGSYGTGDGQFMYPTGIDVDGSGNVYVVDTRNYRIQVFDSSGAFITKWGNYGSGNGQFIDPYGIAVGGNGNVYVADSLNYRIQVFNTSGEFITKWGSYGVYGFRLPRGIAVDVSGNVYVTDLNNTNVQVYNSSGIFIRKWGSLGTGDGQFSNPYGIAVDGSGGVYVVDSSNNRIQVFTSYGAFMTKWAGSYGQDGGQFMYPWGIAVGGNGNVYVADTSNHRIQVFDASGAFITKWGSYGTGDGQFRFPNGIVVDGSGNVYVADTYNHRIQVFNTSGIFIRKWGSWGWGDGQFYNPNSVAVDENGNIYVADTYNHRIQVFNSSGNFLTKWGSWGVGNQFSYPRGVAVDGSGNVYVADTGNSRIRVFDYSGAFIKKIGIDGYGNGDGVFYGPSRIVLDGSGNIYVADTYNHRIQVFNSSGAFLTKWGSPGPNEGQFRIPYGIAVGGNGNIYVADTYNHRIQVFEGGVFSSDTMSPVLSTPTNITVEAVDASGAVVSYTIPVATDDTDPSPVVNCLPLSGSTFALGTTVVTCTATDLSGNSSIGTFNVTVQDTTAPVVTAPGNITVEATWPATSVTLGSGTATDLVDGVLIPIPDQTGPFGVGIHTVVWSATDGTGNTGTATQTVTVTDTTAPVVTAPANITVEATGTLTSVILGSGSATDIVDGMLIPTPDQSGPFAVGIHTIIWSATDSSGNTGTATQTVTVTDSAAPVFPILDDISAEATSAAGAVVNYEVIANDIVDPLPGIICNPASGETFAIGGTTMSCTATDFSGNSSIANFVVTVTASDIDGDGVPDVLDPCPGDANNACNPDSSGAAIIDATSGGIVSTTDGTLVMTVPPNTLSQDTTVSITETGAGGATFELTTNLGEAIGVYGLEILPAGTTFAAPVTLVFAWDDIDNDGTVDGTQIKEENLRITKDGVAITEKCKFDPGCDPAVNTFSVQVTSLSVFVLTFVDDEGPAVTSVTATPNPAEVYTPIILVATLDDTLTGGSNIASAEYNVDNGSYVPMTAQDGVFDSVAEQVMATIPAFTNVGIHSLCVRGMDQFRNVVGFSNCIVLSVVDTTAPVVTAPFDITIEAAGPMTPVTLGTGTASDLVDGALTPTPDQTGPFAVGIHTITWSATDSSGNTGTATQAVIVTDTTPPVMTVPSDILAEATSPSGAVVNYPAPTVIDIADPFPSVVCNPASGNTFPLGTTTVNCNASDAYGNSNSGSFVVTVVSPIEVTDVSLDILPQGATNQNLTITGDNFEAGTTISFSGSGIVVNTVTVMNANQLIVNISIDSVASEGLRNVVVTNTNGLSGTGIGLLQIVTQSGAISDMSNDVLDFLVTGEISNSGIANSLLASLNNANKTLDRNAISATNGILNALINKLDAYLKGNQISSSVKASLETKINALISSL